MFHIFGGTPLLLVGNRVGRDRQEVGPGVLVDFFIKFLGLNAANRRINVRHHADQRWLAEQEAGLDLFIILVKHLKVGHFFPDGRRIADQAADFTINRNFHDCCLLLIVA